MRISDWSSDVCSSDLGSGQIINVSSIGANITAAGVGVYGGLKRALEMFTDSLRVELAGTGVKVGLVAPRTTSTAIFEDMKAHGQPRWDEVMPSLQPEDISHAIADTESTHLNPHPVFP